MFAAEHLHWELSVLSKLVAFKNLSGASSHVGISQPQLSRIISKLERTLGVVILDRSSRRTSSWTQTAHRLAHLWTENSRLLERSIQESVHEAKPQSFHLGTLEGLIPLACRFCEHLYKRSEVEHIQLDVYDLNELEEAFFKDVFDFIFISREPGRKKFKYSRLLGYQSLIQRGKAEEMRVLSAHQFSSKRSLWLSQTKKDHKKAFVSNSLTVRRLWIQDFGGQGTLPSEIVSPKEKKSATEPVYLIGAERLSLDIWEESSGTFRS